MPIPIRFPRITKREQFLRELTRRRMRRRYRKRPTDALWRIPARAEQETRRI